MKSRTVYFTMDDWAELEAEGRLIRPMRKGDQHKQETIEKLREIANRRWQRIRRERAERVRRVREAEGDSLGLRDPGEKWCEILKRRGKTVLAAMLECMEPGGWYAQADLIEILGAQDIPRGSVKAVLIQQAYSKGLVERTTNPAFDPKVYREGVTHFAGSDKVEPRYLYRLTSKGVAARSGH